MVVVEMGEMVMKNFRLFLLALLTSSFLVSNIFGAQQAPRPPMPLANPGNSCYFNAALQCLMHLPTFNINATNVEIAAEEGDYGLNVLRLYNAIRNDRTQAFVTNLLDRLDFGAEQQDIYELLGAFLNELPLDLRTSLNISTQAQNHYQACNHISFEVKNDLVLSLPIQANPDTLQNRLQAYHTGEQIVDARCPRCNRANQIVIKTILAPNPSPQILILHLNRFTHDLRKLDTAIRFPLDNLPYAGAQYRLMGIACHAGMLRGGHYIAYVRSGNQWYSCDDTVIEQEGNMAGIAERGLGQNRLFNTVDAQGTVTGAVNRPYTPYLFFYEKIEGEAPAEVEAEKAPVQKAPGKKAAVKVANKAPRQQDNAERIQQIESQLPMKLERGSLLRALVERSEVNAVLLFGENHRDLIVEWRRLNPQP